MTSQQTLGLSGLGEGWPQVVGLKPQTLNLKPQTLNRGFRVPLSGIFECSGWTVSVLGLLLPRGLLSSRHIEPASPLSIYLSIYLSVYIYIYMYYIYIYIYVDVRILLHLSL